VTHGRHQKTEPMTPGVGTAEKPHTHARRAAGGLSRVTPQRQASADSSSTRVTSETRPGEERLGSEPAGPSEEDPAALKGAAAGALLAEQTEFPNHRLEARAGRRSAVRGYAIDQGSPAGRRTICLVHCKACQPGSARSERGRCGNLLAGGRRQPNEPCRTRSRSTAIRRIEPARPG